MRKWIIIAAVVVVAVVGGYFFIQSQGGLGSLTGRAEADVTPTALPAIQANPEVIVDAVVVPIRYADLSLRTSGVVDDVLFEEGEQVEAGDLIARLENERQLIAIAQAEARVRNAQARIDEVRAESRAEEIAASQAAVDLARADLSRLVESARPEDISASEASLAAAEASLAELLNGADDAEMIQSLAELQNAEAALRQAQTAFDDVKWRSDLGALPQATELERATNNYEAAKARYDLVAAGAKDNELASARAEIERSLANLEKILTPSTASEIAAAEAEVRRAEAELALRRAGARPETIAASEADLTEAQTALMQRHIELADTELRAPFAGTIASLDLQPGEQVNEGTPVVQLADQSQWRIETDDLTEINVVFVQEGDRARLTIDALPDLELEGTVVRIKPLGENKQGDITYTATIEPDTHDDRLRWNMTASATIRTEE